MEAIERSVADWSKVVIVYDPMWHINGGHPQDAEEVEAMHLFIREWIAANVGEEVAEKLRIPYGGTVTLEQAPEI